MKLIILALLLAVAVAAPPHRDVVFGEPEDSKDSEGSLEVDDPAIPPHHDGPATFPGVPHVRQGRDAPQVHRPAPSSVQGVKGSVGDKPQSVNTADKKKADKQTAEGKVKPTVVENKNKQGLNKKQPSQKTNTGKSNGQKKLNTGTSSDVVTNSQKKKTNTQVSNNKPQVAPMQETVVHSVDHSVNVVGQTGVKNLIGLAKVSNLAVPVDENDGMKILPTRVDSVAMVDMGMEYSPALESSGFISPKTGELQVVNGGLQVMSEGALSIFGRDNFSPA